MVECNRIVRQGPESSRSQRFETHCCAPKVDYGDNDGNDNACDREERNLVWWSVSFLKVRIPLAEQG
jgi:hypothetical protein